MLDGRMHTVDGMMFVDVGMQMTTVAGCVALDLEGIPACKLKMT